MHRDVCDRMRALAQGKVRDTYDVGDKLVIVTTDRQSAFDRLLASVPFKVRCSNTSVDPPFNHTAVSITQAEHGSQQMFALVPKQKL